MKLRIYIVDDEQIAIKYFEYLLQNIDVDCEVVGTSTNSSKAVSEIIRLKPDVVFTDISMPVMDGLEVAEKILRQFPVKVFLLTAYRDFDYVKKGMQIGVTDYILKNELEETSLKKLLEKTAEDIMIEKKEQHRILEYNVRSFLLSHSDTLEGYQERRRPMQRYGMLLLLEPSRIYLTHPAGNEVMKADCYELQNLDYPEGLSCTAFTEVTQGMLCGIFYIGEDVPDSQKLLKKAAEVLLDILKEQGKSCICVISDTLKEFFELPDAYKKLKKLIQYTFASPKQFLFRAAELRSQAVVQGTSKNSWDGFLEVLDIKLSEGRKEEVLLELQKLLKEARIGKTLWEYEEELKNLQHCLKRYVKNQQLDPSILELPNEYENADVAEKSFLNCLSGICDLCHEMAEKQYSPYVSQAIHFIHLNYQRDISIPEIAEAVKVSEGHLRRCFKQELGVRIVDYLTEYRLERAKELMKKESGALGEIWQKTGFASAQYFSYVFKKKEGILPREYMRKLRGK